MSSHMRPDCGGRSTSRTGTSWGSQVPVWTTASARALDAFATINAVLWRQIADAEPRPWKRRLRHAATEWAEHRA